MFQDPTASKFAYTKVYAYNHFKKWLWKISIKIFEKHIILIHFMIMLSFIFII